MFFSVLTNLCFYGYRVIASSGYDTYYLIGKIEIGDCPDCFKFVGSDIDYLLRFQIYDK